MTFSTSVLIAAVFGAVRGEVVRDSLQDSLQEAIRRDLSGSTRTPASADRRWRSVQSIYAARDHRPVWLDGRRLNARAVTLAAALAEAPAEGLSLEAYQPTTLQATLAAIAPERRPGAPQLAAADIALTAAYARLGDDWLTGQIDPRTVIQGWHIDPRGVDVDSALARTLNAAPFDQALARLRPSDPDYGALQRELARYRELVVRGGWPGVPGAKVLRPGNEAPVARLAALAERLRAESYLEAGSGLTRVLADTGALAATTPASAIYDDRLAGAVARYQARHGLVVDSILGPNTLAALNRPAEYRARQIAANLERHRWLPRALGSDYVLVNVPAFRLVAFRNGEPALSMKVIVGAEYSGRSTPVFSDTMQYLVFRPYWNVPQGIAAAELWPPQRRDPSYFARHGYEVVRASWGTYVRQKPGPENALGLVKFIFPNDHAIYLHDTPARALFDEDVRAYSHGCIRVERPAELAQFVLGWDIGRVRDAMARGADDTRVNLDRKMPVYIVYFTTYTRDATLYFANDLYERDDALIQAIGEGAIPAAAARQTMEAARDLVSELARAE